MEHYYVPESICPGCGAELAMATNDPRLNPIMTHPKPGSFTVCMHCGEILVFNEELRLVKSEIPANADEESRQILLALQRNVRGGYALPR